MKLEDHIFKSESFIELVNEAVKFMINTPVESLPPDDRFSGAGVYALYYTGDFPLYKKYMKVIVSFQFMWVKQFYLAGDKAVVQPKKVIQHFIAV